MISPSFNVANTQYFTVQPPLSSTMPIPNSTVTSTQSILVQQQIPFSSTSVGVPQSIPLLQGIPGSYPHATTIVE